MSATKSVLIIGGSGFVGTHLALRLRESYKVFATYVNHPITIPGVTTLPMHVDNRGWIKQVVRTTKPEVILYAPGEGSRRRMDYIELENIYSKGAANVLNCAEMLQPKFIYFSNSYVFAGDRGNYRETEAAIPATTLGKAKISGENFIKSKSLHSLIVRSAPLFGRGNGTNLSFLDRLRMQLDRGKPIELPSNEIQSYAPVDGLVGLIAELISKPSFKQKILHYGGLTKMSTAEFGKAFATRFGYDPRLIVPTFQAREDGNHSLDYSLNCSQAVELLKIKPLLLEESFDLIEKKLVAGT